MRNKEKLRVSRLSIVLAIFSALSLLAMLVPAKPHWPHLLASHTSPGRSDHGAS